MKLASLFRKNYNGIFLSDVLLTLGAFIVSSLVFTLERSLFLCLLVGLLSVVINMKWGLRRRAWFWLVLSAFFVAHVLLIFSIPMPREFKMAAAFAPVVILEGLLLLGIIGLIEKRTG